MSALLLTACAANQQRVYEKTHVGLFEPVATEIYNCEGGRPKFARNQTPAGTPLKNGGAEFERGFSVMGEQKIIYSLDPEQTELSMTVCMDESSKKGAKAEVALIGNGKTLWEGEIGKGSFEEIKKTFKGAESLVIHVKAEDGAVVDFLEPKLEGGAKLRETMIYGRTNYAASCKSPAFKNFPTYNVGGVTVFSRASYAEYGPVVGLSNAYACAMIAPEHHGMLVHYGPNSTSTYGGTMQSFLQPEEEIEPTRRYGALVANPKKWKWRIEDDGALRVLAPPDLLNGVRRMIVYRLNPRSGELDIDLMAKNISGHDIMGCLSMVTRFPEGYPVALQAEKAKPGYSLVKGSDEGIVARDGVVVINQLESWYPLKGPQKLIQRNNGDFLLIQKKGYFKSKSLAPTGGYFPYNGQKLTLYNSKKGVLVTQYGEKLKMTPTQTLHLRLTLDLEE